MAVKAKKVDREQERRLLNGWTQTTQFDKLPEGIPPLDPENDDED